MTKQRKAFEGACVELISGVTSWGTSHQINACARIIRRGGFGRWYVQNSKKSSRRSSTRCMRERTKHDSSRAKIGEFKAEPSQRIKIFFETFRKPNCRAGGFRRIESIRIDRAVRSRSPYHRSLIKIGTTAMSTSVPSVTGPHRGRSFRRRKPGRHGGSFRSEPQLPRRGPLHGLTQMN